MNFIDERIPREKWEFVNQYAPSLEISKYLHWLADYENDIYWVEVDFNAFEHLNYYLLIWKGKKTLVGTYSWLEGASNNRRFFSNIILFQADVSLKSERDELVQIVKEALSARYTYPFLIKEMVEPDFSKEFK